MTEYKNRKVLVIGLARSGAAACRLLDGLGASSAVTDLRTESELASFAESLPEATVRLLGGHEGVRVSDYDLAVISPGVPWDSPLATAVREAGVDLISEAELAFTLLSAPVIAVTGSNGKSTTTALIGRMLEEAGRKVYVGGNIGAPLADAVGKDYDWIVAEISSFQLEGARTFRPSVGVVLNITPDHMDRHGDMDTYASLKARLYENQREGDTLVLNAADPRVARLPENPRTAVLRFGQDPVEGAGAWIEDEWAVARTGSGKLKLFAVDELAIKGLHNRENALAASLAALAAGAPPEAVRKAAMTFAGLAHRMELVDTIGGVAFYNDSKATNAEAAAKSLSGFEKNVALIAGGSSKGLDFTPLVEAVYKNAKGVVLIGQTASEIEKALGIYQPKVRAADMDEAVRIAASWCGEGDAVLLSPGCASFDMYKNFEERGGAFRAAVEGLKEGAPNAG